MDPKLLPSQSPSKGEKRKNTSTLESDRNKRSTNNQPTNRHLSTKPTTENKTSNEKEKISGRGSGRIRGTSRGRGSATRQESLSRTHNYEAEHMNNNLPSPDVNNNEITLANIKIKHLESELQNIKDALQSANISQLLKLHKQQNPPHDQPHNKEVTLDDNSTVQGKPKKIKYIPLNMEDDNLTVNEQTNYMINFENEDLKRKVNPFSLRKTVEEITGYAPKALHTYGKNSFSILMEKECTELVESIKEISNIPCTCVEQYQLNTKRALIYIHEFTIENLSQFHKDLQYNYPNIISIEKATFITTRNKKTTPLILTIKGRRLPDCLYIPGERSDTKVYPMQNKPMICQKCWNYGHTKKKCRSNMQYCQKCSSPQHKTNECNAEKLCCRNCSESHRSGARECPKHQKEIKLMEIAEQNRVNIRRARQIEAGITLTKRTKTFATHYDITFENENTKRKIHPFTLEKCITIELCGKKPTKIRSKNETTFTVEINSSAHGILLQHLKKINNHEVTVTANNMLSQSKGIVYINDYDLTEFDKYKEGLKTTCGVQDIELAKWIKPKSTKTTALLLSFFDKEVPDYIDIPGEQTFSKVYEYKRSPQHCKKCQEYGHTVSTCKKETQRCRKCSKEGHSESECNDSVYTCHQCSEPHYTASKNCPVYRKELEILAIMTKERKTRAQAQLDMMWRQPHPNLNYRAALINPSPTVTNVEKILPDIPQINYNSQLSPLTSTVEDAVHFFTQDNPYVLPSADAIISFYEQDVAQDINLSQICSQEKRTPGQELERIEVMVDVHAPQSRSPSFDPLIDNDQEDIFNTLPTPDHLTSENNDDIRRQAYKIYNSTTNNSPGVISEDIHSETDDEELYRKSLSRVPNEGHDKPKFKKRSSRSKSSSRLQSPDSKKYRTDSRDSNSYARRRSSLSRDNDKSESRSRSNSRK